MSFKIILMTENCEHVYSLPGRAPGLALLDAFRAKYGSHIKALHEAAESQEVRYVLYIDEETARQSGLFRDEGELHVEVRPHFLNQFAEILPASRDATTHPHVSTEWEIIDSKVIAAWVAAKFPIKWMDD